MICIIGIPVSTTPSKQVLLFAVQILYMIFLIFTRLVKNNTLEEKVHLLLTLVKLERPKTSPFT